MPSNIQAQIGQAVTMVNWKIIFVNWREITTGKRGWWHDDIDL
jgi:hypothetical protein